MSSKSTIAPSLLLVLALVAPGAGCGSDTRSGPSPQRDAGDDAAQTDDSPAADSHTGDDVESDSGAPPDAPTGPIVTIETRDRYGFATGAMTDVVRKNPSWVGVSVLHGAQSFEGEAQPNGSFVVHDVPDGPATVRMVLREETALPGDLPAIWEFPVTFSAGARTVRFGGDFWGREAEPLVDEGTQFALSVATPAGFSSGDEFSWISLNSYLYRNTSYDADSEQPGLPAEGAAESNDWRTNTEDLIAPYGYSASGLPRAGDDLTILQQRSSTNRLSESAGDPWNTARETSTVGMLTTTTASFANGTSNLVSGALVAPETSTKTLLLAGETFGTLRTAGLYPSATRSSATLTLLQEVGAGPQLFASIGTPFWKLRAVSNRSGGDPGPMSGTFALPVLPQTTAHDLFEVNYTFDYTVPGLYVRMTASAYRLFKPEPEPDAVTGQVMLLELSPVTNLDVGVSWQDDGSIADHSGPVEVRFDVPEYGTPDSYEVRVIDLSPDFDAPEGTVEYPRSSRVVATYVTRATTQAIPAELLRDQHTYYVRVTASNEGVDYHQPSVFPTNVFDRTAIFSPPFRYIAE